MSKQDQSNAASNEPLSPVKDNIVLTSVKELSALQTNMEDIRAELRARGIQRQTTNVMVEMAFHHRQEDMQVLMDTALQGSEKKYGHGAITRNDLQEALDNLLALEKDVVHARTLCKQQGLNLPVLNMLVQLVRKNPGDSGAKAINTFLGYARACDFELSGIDEFTQKFTVEPASVLPTIERAETDKARFQKQKLVRDIFIGLTLTVVMYFLTT